ncbi:permease prefix domain 1-containing protein [Plantactinospora sp. KLBMP9567]|uniref:permease prefix domain 1-containing protein n=1 Tax=Plantactinospora sp. KLBMP9567 TaxID=3085900 RepID=UPI0029816B64|nr:permease prefix domain 1-containing protein [Plantactinospora sp. KLBMP9567]MDW5328206.1 permease prefix domain 1-containing protein [Plantactinospora sp. KLBMP9567]
MTGDGERVEASDQDEPAAVGVVARHLDEMFDQLAGTGAVGRRLLAEVEDHLRDAVADEMAQGVPAERAERNAVTRFGPPDRIAGDLRRARRGLAVAPVVSGAWLLTGLATVLFAATFLLKALDVAMLRRAHPEQLPSCAERPGVPADISDAIAPCGAGVAATHTYARIGLIALLVAVVVLTARWLTIRNTALPPAPQRCPLLAAALFAVAGVVLFLQYPVTPSGRPLFGASGGTPLWWTGSWHQITVSGLALLTSVAIVCGYVAQGRRA